MSKSPLISKTELHSLVPCSPSTIDRLERLRQFPRRLTLAPGSRRIFWRRAEVTEWLRDRGIELERAAAPEPARDAKARAASSSREG